MTNRRAFLRCVGAASVWSAVWAKAATAGYAYIGSLGPAGRDSIEVFRVEGTRWRHVQEVAAHAPVALALDANRQVLYAVNQVAIHEGLPQGTVQVFSIDRQSGLLSLVQRQALSLSGTNPRSLAIAPDGRYVVVAVYGGGAYNILPIQQDGRLGRVRRIFKEAGCGEHAEHQASAHPHTVLFDRSGRFALTSDLGCDQLNVFELSNNGEWRRRNKVSISSGAGAGPMVLHGGGSFLYVMHELKPAISCHRYTGTEGVISEAFQNISLGGQRENGRLVRGALAMDSKGRFLYATSEMGSTVLAIDTVSGALAVKQRSGYGDTLHISPDDRTLHAIDRKSGSISRMNVNPRNGRWDDIARVASVESPVSFAFLAC